MTRCAIATGAGMAALHLTPQSVGYAGNVGGAAMNAKSAEQFERCV
ncbi:MAG: hypothetical protein ABI144_08360 [Gallionella sp.]